MTRATSIFVHGKCSRYSSNSSFCCGYEFAVCVEVDGELYCLQHLLHTRVSNETLELVKGIHAEHHSEYLEPKDCSFCDDDAIVVWLQLHKRWLSVIQVG